MSRDSRSTTRGHCRFGRGRRIESVGLLFGALAMAAIGCAETTSPDEDARIEDNPEFSELLASTPQGLTGLSGLGEAVLIDFGANSTVTSVFVRLRAGIISPPAIAARSSLDITITSVDGIDHFHGTALIPVVDVVEVDREGGHVTGQITWTEDHEPEVVNDLYTVCSTLQIDLGSYTWYGPERCQDFGPFF